MFGWFTNKKIKIKSGEIPFIAEDMQEIFRHLSETCVIGMLASLKTYSPEIKNNTSWRIETINEKSFYLVYNPILFILYK